MYAASSLFCLTIVLAALGRAVVKWTPDTYVSNNESLTTDYVVVGAGTAGSIVGYRLSEDPDVDVTIIEAGDDPTPESELPGLFPAVVRTKIDWNYTSEDDGFSAQYHRNKFLDLSSGKVLGGSSSLHHLYYVRGDAKDYEDWSKAAGDDAWTKSNLLPFFKKSERLEDPEIQSEDNGVYHGTDGEIGITRHLTPLPPKYLEAFEEVGHEIVNDLNGIKRKGYGQPMFYVSGGKRQSSAESYLTDAKSRSNLHLIKSTTVNKIIFDSHKNAIGVECASADGRLFKVYARKEVIISAGVFNTPKLLKLSGIGPQKELKSFGIKVISDLPVGENLQDHLAVVLVHGLEATTDAPPAGDPTNFPLETFVGLGSVDPLQQHPDYISLNLICRNDPTCIQTLCGVVLGLHDDVCSQLVAAGDGREVLFTVMNVVRPVSTGRVLLRSTDPNDPPKIYTGFLSDSADLDKNVQCIEDFVRVTESSYFKSVGGETLFPSLPNCDHLEAKTTEYWKCYVFNMMDTTFHYGGTSPMGTVLDSELRVRGVGRLRVGDASGIPNIVSGGINAAVVVLAEKLADLIKQSNA